MLTPQPIRKRSWIRRLGIASAVAGVMTAASLVVAVPAHAAGTTLRVTQVQCSEESSEIGGDSPYFLVFTGSKTNPGATSFGHWGPGYLDDQVNSGEIFNPNATIVTGVSSNSWVISLLVEEDWGHDLNSWEYQQISNAVHNQYQVSFWHSQSQMLLEMRAALISATSSYLSNDDIVASAASSTSASGAWSLYDDGDARYWVKYTLV